MLEALLKRVDGLEAKLKEKKENPSSPSSENGLTTTEEESTTTVGDSTEMETKPKTVVETPRAVEIPESAVYSPSPSRCAKTGPQPNGQACHGPLTDQLCSASSPAGVQADALLDTYFSRFHAKPFYILDESSVRQRLQLNQLPSYLVHAIYAVAAR